MWQCVKHKSGLHQAWTCSTSKQPCTTRLPRHSVRKAMTDSGGRQPSALTEVDSKQEGQGMLQWLLPRQMVAMASAGAVLGPLLDGQHSFNNVLHYHDPMFLHIGNWQLETCWWVPVLFGLAGVIIGVGVPGLDLLLNNKQSGDSSPQAQSDTSNVLAQSISRGEEWQAPSITSPPSWMTVYACIAVFVAQYGLSGKLDGLLGETNVHTVVIHSILAVWAGLHFYAFDRTIPGFILSVATAVGGPLIEVLLISGPHLYHYEKPDVLGIPLWIAWVYFCGGPAVGNLGRRVWATLQDAQRTQ